MRYSWYKFSGLSPGHTLCNQYHLRSPAYQNVWQPAVHPVPHRNNQSGSPVRKNRLQL